MGSIAAKKTLTNDQVMTDAQASEYDFIILVDQSGSMDSPSTKMEGKTRWQEAQEFTESYARFAGRVDDDGITVITFNGHATMYDGVTADKIHEVFTKERPNGSTKLAPALNEAFKKKFSSNKKALIMVITDGEANDPSDVRTAIVNAANKITNGDEIGIQFVQIGEDPAAAKFLNELDEHLKGTKFDIVNSLTREEAEEFTMEQLCWLAVND